MLLNWGVKGRTFSVGLVIILGLGLACDNVSPSEQLSITRVTPGTGPSGGGDQVVVEGTGFRSGATVTLGGAAATATFQEGRSIRVLPPAHPAGAVDVVVTNPDGASARLAAGYTYVPLTVTAISPTSALTREQAQVYGMGFVHGSTVTLGGAIARVVGVSSAVITIAIPDHPPELVDVVVTNPSGETSTLSGGFTFTVVVLTAGPSVVTTGGQLTVTWSAPPGRSTAGGGDWIALFKAGDPDSASVTWFTHLEGASSGTVTFKAPIQPGQYEMRYMVEATSVARAPVTVTAGG